MAVKKTTIKSWDDVRPESLEKNVEAARRKGELK